MEERFARSRGNQAAKTLCALGIILLMGCDFRFGDYTSQPPSSGTTAALYDANPSSLQFCATSGQAAPHCASASTSQIPPFVSDYITNPVVLAQTSNGSGFYDPQGTGQNGFPVVVGSDGELSYADNSTSSSLWNNDPNCTTTFYLSENGSIVPPSSGTTNPDGSSGSLSLTVQLTQTFDGSNCGVDLQSMSECYQSATQCGGADTTTNQQLQTQAQGVFSTYIQAGAMAVTDIPNLTSVSYEVRYQ